MTNPLQQRAGRGLGFQLFVPEKLRVYETTDRGSNWRALGDGLPQSHTYLLSVRCSA